MFKKLFDFKGSKLKKIYKGIMLLGVIAWHSYVGVKSLIRDLQLPRSLKLPIRVAIIVIAIAIAAIALWGIF